jgi:hypothetical protein
MGATYHLILLLALMIKYVMNRRAWFMMTYRAQVKLTFVWKILLLLQGIGGQMVTLLESENKHEHLEKG